MHYTKNAQNQKESTRHNGKINGTHTFFSRAQLSFGPAEWKIMNSNHYTYEMYTKDKDGKEFKS